MIVADPKELGAQQNESPLDAELADVLGVDPEEPKTLKIKLHSSIHKRWLNRYEKGLKKPDRAELLEKYDGLPGLKAPKINPEILATLPKDMKTRDAYVMFRQSLASGALAALGLAAERLTDGKENLDRKSIFRYIIDAGTLIADLMHSQTKS